MYNSTHDSAWWPGKSKGHQHFFRAEHWCNPTQLSASFDKKCSPIYASRCGNYLKQADGLSTKCSVIEACSKHVVQRGVTDWSIQRALISYRTNYWCSQSVNPRWKSGGLTINNCTNWCEQSIDNQHLLHWPGIWWLELQAQTFPSCAFAPRWLPV